MTMTIDISKAHSSNDARRARNEERAEDQGLESCVCCGRGVKESSVQYVMCVDGSVEKVANPAQIETWQDDAGFMGCFPVGPTCAKKLHRLGVPKGWTFKLES